MDGEDSNYSLVFLVSGKGNLVKLSLFSFGGIYKSLSFQRDWSLFRPPSFQRGG
jgi:hypothetical protein